MTMSIRITLPVKWNSTWKTVIFGYITEKPIDNSKNSNNAKNIEKMQSADVRFEATQNLSEPYAVCFGKPINTYSF